MTSIEAAAKLRSVLDGPQRKVISTLNTEPMTKEDVAQAAGYQATSGGIIEIPFLVSTCWESSIDRPPIC